jgi:hypothetical protein
MYGKDYILTTKLLQTTIRPAMQMRFRMLMLMLSPRNYLMYFLNVIGFCGTMDY